MNAIHVCRSIGLLQDCLLLEQGKDGVVFSTVPLEPTSALVTPTISTRASKKNLDFLQSELLEMPSCTKLAVTGEALIILQETSRSDFIDWILENTVVFSRAKPDQKAWLIERYIGLGRVVAMCGDGTNDCGALKAAHIGLALTDTEASVAATFTSCKKLVSDVDLLLREGRCALETSLTAFKVI